MQDTLTALVAKAQPEFAALTTRPEFEAAKARYVGPNGELTALMKQMGTVPKEQRPALGKLINETKTRLQSLLDAALAQIEAAELQAQLGPAVDATLPAPDIGPGTYHPLTLVREEMCRILRKVGFTVADGPEVETEYYCFDALNTPAERASGQVFLRVLKDALFGEAGGADLLLPRVDLSALLPEAALVWLTERGPAPRLGARVQTLVRCATGWQLSASGSADADDIEENFDAVLLACPPPEAARLAALATALDAVRATDAAAEALRDAARFRLFFAFRERLAADLRDCFRVAILLLYIYVI